MSNIALTRVFEAPSVGVGDEYGDSLGTATAIEISDGFVLSSSIQAIVNNSIDRDYVQFIAPQSGTWTVTTTATNQVFTGFWNEDRNSIGGINDVGAFTVELTEGNLYYLGVEPWVAGETPEFEVSLDFTPGAVIDDGAVEPDPDDEFGSGFGDATVIQLTSGLVLTGAIQDPIENSNSLFPDRDFVQFTAPSSGTLTITTSATEQLATLLWNEDREQIGGINDAGSFSATLVAGELYYIGLEAWQATETPSYTASLDFVSDGSDDVDTGGGTNPPPTGDGSDTFASPTAISSPVIFTQTVGGSDQVDYFSITPLTDTTLELSLTGLTSDIDLQLFNDDGIRLDASRNTGTENEDLSVPVSANQTYIIGTTPSTGQSGSYTLNAVLDAADGGNGSTPVADGGNTFATPTEISSPISISQSVGGTDPIDYFSLTPSATGTLELSMTGITGDLDLQLFNTSGIRLAASRNDGLENENLLFEVQADETYVIAVTSNTSNGGAYVLNGALVSGTNADAGNTLDTATAIDLPETVQQSIGFGGDPQDLFTVTPDDDGRLNITLSGLAADADLHLYNASGVRLAAPGLSGTADEIIGFDVTGGEEYFIGVVPKTNTGTDYTLNVTVGAQTSSSAAQAVAVDEASAVDENSPANGYALGTPVADHLALAFDGSLMG